MFFEIILRNTEKKGGFVKKINLPLTDKMIASFRIGDELLLSGTIFTGRDQVHKKIYELLKNGETLPFQLQNNIIYYVGPAPKPDNMIIGSCGPTTSSRMDKYTPLFLENGLKGMIGKGPRSEDVRQAIKKNGAIYFYAFGGCGALYAEKVRSVELVAFPELGPEAIYKIDVLDFPVIVAIDSAGNSIFDNR